MSNTQASHKDPPRISGLRSLLYRLIWRPIIAFFALVWHVIWGLWGTIIIGAIVVGVIGNAAYTYLTKGHFDPINLPHLPIIQAAAIHPLQTTFVVVLLAFLTLFSYLAHRSQRQAARDDEMGEYALKRVDQLDPNNYKLFRYVKQVYLRREADTIAQQLLRDLAAERVPTPGHMSIGICVFGRPTQGKTRLAWEAMQAELANWTLVRWPHAAQVPFNFVAQKGKQIILWLDDLHEYANPTESVIINDLPRRFMEEKARLIVIATCRDGEDQLQATQYLGALLEQLIPITLEDISINDAHNLAKDLTQEGLEISNDEFDGTPGSLIFGLQRMTRRYLSLTPSAQTVLKAMKLLHSVRIHTYAEIRVKNVSHDVFGLEKKEWRKSYESLDRSDFIRITTLNNERIFEPIAEIYLEKVVIDYPTPHSMLIDDWVNLKECFQRHKDADGLVSLGLFVQMQFLKTQQLNTYQFSEECYYTASEVFLDKHDHLNWAGTQNNLGTLFVNQADQTIGDQAIKFLDEGIEAFNAALTVFSKENTLAGWVMVQCNLGDLLTQKARLVNDEGKLKLLDNAIQIFQDILKFELHDWIVTAQILSKLGVALSFKSELIEKDKQNQFLDVALQIFRVVLDIHTQGHLPIAWAGAQTNLGAALSRKANLANNQEERRNLLNQTVQAHRAALTVYTKESTPLDWASTQFNLGSTLSDDARLVKVEDRNNLLNEAIEAYHAALTVFSKEDTPINWSSTQYELGNVLQTQARLMKGNEQLQQIDEAIQAYNAALEVYNTANFPKEWAMTQLNMGQALYYKATLLDGKERYSLLEESIQAFHKALEIYTQEHNKSAWSSFLNKAIQAYYAALNGWNKTDNSTQWTLAQLNLSIALESLAKITDSQKRQTLLDEGLDASKAALSIYTHENNPLNYAKAEQLLGTFLFLKTFPSDDALQIETIKAAISAFRSALEIFTKENSMTDWAQTQHALGDAITSLFELLQENITPDLVFSAIKAYQSALEVYTPENNPSSWARANIGIALTYHVSTLFMEDKNKQVALLHEAHRILDSVLISHTPTREEHIFLTMLIQRIKDDLDKIENIA